MVKFSPSCNCCGPEDLFYCSKCGALPEALPGCAVVSVYSLDYHGDCHDADLCDAWFSGPVALQADPLNLPLAAAFNQCAYALSNPCICSNQYGYPFDVGPANDDTVGAQFGFFLQVNAGNYQIRPYAGFAPSSYNGITPAANSQVARADPNLCDDFPLSWLGIPIFTPQAAGGECGTQLTGLMDIQFSLTGCALAGDFICGSNVCLNCEITPQFGAYTWCNDRGAASYGKKVKQMRIQIPANYDNNGALAVDQTVDIEFSLPGGNPSIRSQQIAPGAGGGEKFYDTNRVGSEIYAKQGFAPSFETFAEPIEVDVCGNNQGCECDNIEGVYVGTFQNATVSALTEEDCVAP